MTSDSKFCWLIIIGDKAPWDRLLNRLIPFWNLSSSRSFRREGSDSIQPFRRRLIHLGRVRSPFVIRYFLQICDFLGSGRYLLLLGTGSPPVHIPPPPLPNMTTYGSSVGSPSHGFLPWFDRQWGLSIVSGFPMKWTCLLLSMGPQYIYPIRLWYPFFSHCLLRLPPPFLPFRISCFAVEPSCRTRLWNFERLATLYTFLFYRPLLPACCRALFREQVSICFPIFSSPT